jgi:hypothetical protein
LQLRFKWALLTYRLANAIFACKQLWRTATAPARRLQHACVQQLSRHLRGRHITKAQAQLLAQAACAVLLVAATALLWRLLALALRRVSKRSVPGKMKRQ